MVELIAIYKGKITFEDICLDPCAGTGTFLLAFMDRQISKYGDRKEAKRNLIGIEDNDEIFVLSVANKLVRGDGKANLKKSNCIEPQKFIRRDEKEQKEKTIKSTIGLMNPPYSDPKRSEIEFVEKLLNLVKRGGYAAVLVPVPTF